MDIIIVNHKRGRTWRWTSTPRSVLQLAPVALLFAALCAGLVAAGWWAGTSRVAAPIDVSGIWADEIAVQGAELAETRQRLQDHTHAIARRLAQLQAHVIRLDAAGQRLTELASLDAGEFDFDSPPAMGGPELELESQAQSLDYLVAQLDLFERQMTDRQRQMRVLEDLLLAGRLQQEVRPSGWPVATGWISSRYGVRTDPFTGRRAYHQGMDFAGREGSDVQAVASGVITESGRRFGYGNLVEINHGNGYVTRYAHNKDLVVEVGERVRKGQVIATLGQTGRATGPHVHFEVLLNGRVVDPAQYIQAAR